MSKSIVNVNENKDCNSDVKLNEKSNEVDEEVINKLCS